MRSRFAVRVLYVSALGVAAALAACSGSDSIGAETSSGGASSSSAMHAGTGTGRGASGPSSGSSTHHGSSTTASSGAGGAGGDASGGASASGGGTVGRGGGGAAPGIACEAMGTFCGGHNVDGGDPSTLYACPGAGAAPVSSSACADGCDDTGTTDACKTTTGGSLTCAGAGLYCGGDMIGGDTATLYDCPGAGLAPTSSQPCANGCQVNAPGTNDLCKGGVVCSGPGDYCGGDSMGGDTNTLYHCDTAGSAPGSSTPCANGCDVMPSGRPDVCRGGLSCPGAGDYCGADGVQGGDASTLYHCPGAGQAPSSSDVCGGGCSIKPAGTPDVCNSGASCPSGGDYCGGDGVSGPSNVLFHCVAGGQAPASSTTCAAGCSVQPPGTPDFCASGGTGSCSASAQAALNWEANQLNTGNPWSDYCLGFVYQAYQHAGGAPGYLAKPTADSSLQAAEATGQFVAWNGSCPCGAILYWAANSCNGEDGHVVICNGDGTVSTSGWPGFNGNTNATISWLDGQECGATPSGYILP